MNLGEVLGQKHTHSRISLLLGSCVEGGQEKRDVAKSAGGYLDTCAPSVICGTRLLSVCVCARVNVWITRAVVRVAFISSSVFSKWVITRSLCSRPVRLTSSLYQSCPSSSDITAAVAAEAPRMIS